MVAQILPKATFVLSKRTVFVFSKDEAFRVRQERIFRRMNDDLVVKGEMGVVCVLVEKIEEIGQLKGDDRALLHDPTIEEVRILRSMQDEDFPGERGIVVLIDKSAVSSEDFEQAGATSIFVPADASLTIA